nr:unnamed protein product [Spirometra erinaceieuropaei]
MLLVWEILLTAARFRWAEHFRGVLNRPSTISDTAIARLPQLETNVDLDLPPFLHETIRTVQQLPSSKGPGSDAIPAEIYKHGGLSDCAFPGDVASRRIPQDFRDATIVHLYKRKGNRQICDTHRGISLLHITGKMFARIFRNRLNNHLEQDLLPKSQCGFRRHRGTTDMIFAARQLQEKCQEMRTHPYSTLLDLAKSFGTVNREGLWKIMQKSGCPERFYRMLLQLHDGMMARVTDNGAVSEALSLTSGVKKGCVLAPTLFSLMSSVILIDAYGDESPRIRVAYRTDGHLLNLHFQSRVSTTTVHELLFADDCALNATTEGHMQKSMDIFSAPRENFGLIINTEKTVVMHQPPPNTAHNAPSPPDFLVWMNDERLPAVLFYGDVATGSHRQGGRVRRYKDTIKTSLKRLQINPANWEDLVRDRPMWRRTANIGAAILKANRITAAKAKRETRKSQLPPPHNANANHLQRTHDVDGHSGRQPDWLDTSGPTAARGLYQ